MNSIYQGVPATIFLADDDGDDRFFFDKALKEIPIPTKLTLFENGEDLLKHLFENSDKLPDIIFLDLSMPRKTGIECLFEIKNNIKFENIPVIILTTSFTRPGIDLEASLSNTLAKMGSQDFIRKPSDINELKLVIHKVLLKEIQNGKLKYIDKIA